MKIFSQEAWHEYETNPDFMATSLGYKMFKEIQKEICKPWVK